MSIWVDMILVSLVKSKNDEVAVTERGYEQVKLFSGNLHFMEWLMRFIGITAAL